MRKNLRGVALFSAILLMLPCAGMAENRQLLGGVSPCYESMILVNGELYVSAKTSDQILVVPLDGTDIATFPARIETMSGNMKIIRSTMALVSWDGVPHAIEEVYTWENSGARVLSIGLYRLNIGEDGMEHTLVTTLNWGDFVNDSWGSEQSPNVMSAAIADGVLCAALDASVGGLFPLTYQRLDTGETGFLPLDGEEFGVYPLDEHRLLIYQLFRGEYIVSALNAQDLSCTELFRLPQPEFSGWDDGSYSYPTGFAANAARDSLCWNREQILYRVPLSNPTAEPEEIGRVPIELAYDGLLADDGSYYAMAYNYVVRVLPESSAKQAITLATNIYTDAGFEIQNADAILEHNPMNPDDVAEDLLAGRSKLDVVSLSSGAPDVRDLVEAGCLLPLDTPALREYAASLYPYAMEGICKDGVPYVLPIRCNTRYSNFYCNEEMMERYSVEMPESWMELLDVLNNWDAPLAEDEMLFSSRTKLLWGLLESYRAWWQAEGDPDAFDTPLLRRLLDKFSQTSYPKQEEEAQYGWGHSSIVLFSPGDEFCPPNSRLLPLEAGMQTHVLCGLVYVAVNADTENPEWALRFAEYMVENAYESYTPLLTTSGVPASDMEICTVDFSGIVNDDVTTALHQTIQQYADGNISQDALVNRLVQENREIQ